MKEYPGATAGAKPEEGGGWCSQPRDRHCEGVDKKRYKPQKQQNLFSLSFLFFLFCSACTKKGALPSRVLMYATGGIQKTALNYGWRAEISIEDHVAGPLEDKPLSRAGNIALVR